MHPLEHEIKELIVSTLALEDLRPQDIPTDEPLFVEGLGLDSIDALELGVALQKRYGITLSADPAETRRHFASVATLARFISDSRGDAVAVSASAARQVNP